jgi:hypothetical protein
MHTQEILKAFADATQSLKLYRRAELRDENTDAPLIEHLYVDPLQNNAVLETMMRPNTTLVIGRKGTGKSTVFQRAQYEIRKNKRYLSAYIDIKTIYESSEVDPTAFQRLADSALVAGEAEMKRILLYRAFSKAVFAEIQKELRDQINRTWFERAKELVNSDRSKVIEILDTLLDEAFDSDFLDVTNIKKTITKTQQARKKQYKAKAGAALKSSASAATAEVSTSLETGSELSRSQEENYAKVLLSTFSINTIMERLAGLLSGIGIGHLFIFIDDFSELPEEAMRVFVDSILAPLNNWSNELIKFKVACYPGRVYIGKIDKTKIDEIFLDTFKLYGSSDLSKMEEKAIDFTKRLLCNRFNYYANQPFETLCDGERDEIYRHLFYASSGNARNLGHILSKLYENYISYGRNINISAISYSSASYYEEKIEPYFGIQKFSHETFGERSSIFSLKELLESIVSRAKDLRDYKDSTVTMEIKGRTPSSHFHIVSELDSLLSTLELNFFVTKYYEMKDRDGRKVSIYALNHGLCSRYSIAFGRPKGKREFRTYYIERIFDYTPILKRYLEINQELKCKKCGAIHGLDKLESIRLFDFMCPTCKKGTCVVTNLSRKYESVLRDIDEDMLLPPMELGILNVLYTEKKELYAADIAEELDCSFQLVGKRGKILAERGLVDRGKKKGNRRLFKITEDAFKEYFEGNKERRLDVEGE